MGQLIRTRGLHRRAWARPVASGLSVRVWRLIGGAPQGLFTYAGSIDATVLRAVMQHVRRLTNAVPGDWCVDVVGSGLDGGLLQAVRDDLGDLRRSGLRPELSVRMPHPALTPMLREPGVLLH